MPEYYGTPDESPEIRAFWGFNADGELEVSNVRSYAVQWFGDPPSDLAVRIHFHGTPDNYEAVTIGFQIDLVRKLHRDLGEMLAYLEGQES